MHPKERAYLNFARIFPKSYREHVGKLLIYAGEKTDADSFLTALEKGRNIVLGKEVNIFVTAFHQIIKEKNYFKEARARGKGWLWVSDHAREMHLLQHKREQTRIVFRKYAQRIGLSRKDYEEYMRLRFGYDSEK